MKEYKQIIIDRLADAGKKSTIVYLKEIALEAGVSRLCAYETREVLLAAKKRLPDMRLFKLSDDKNCSLWESAVFIDKFIEPDTNWYKII